MATGDGWVMGRLAKGVPEVRWILLPHAGGGPGTFTSWRPHVPEGVELAPVGLPGRGPRVDEPAPEDFDTLVDRLAAGLVAETTLPYVLFGHSTGGLLAYELALRAEAAGGRAPLATVVSGCRAPNVPVARRVSALGDQEFEEWLVDIGGLPPELLPHRELVDLAVRTVRADLALSEEYVRPQPAALRRPLHVFAGVADEVAPSAGLGEWRACAAGGFSATVLPGGHAFPFSDPATLIAAMTTVLPAPEE